MTVFFIVFLLNLMHPSTKAIVLIVVWRWWYCFSNAQYLADVFELFWNKVCSCIWNHLAGQPIFWKDNLACFIRLYILSPSTFCDCKFTVVICNTKIMLVINCKDVNSDRLPWPLWYFVWHYFVLWSCCLTIKTCGPAFDCFIYIGIHVDSVYWLTH